MSTFEDGPFEEYFGTVDGSREKVVSKVNVSSDLIYDMTGKRYRVGDTVDVVLAFPQIILGLQKDAVTGNLMVFVQEDIGKYCRYPLWQMISAPLNYTPEFFGGWKPKD